MPACQKPVASMSLMRTYPRRAAGLSLVTKFTPAGWFFFAVLSKLMPLSSLVLVCELAGSYDLLVPLMLAEGIAFVVLRRRSLYRAQLPTQRDSPACVAMNPSRL